MEHGLYVVATPIGHLDDISMRALSILQQVDVIACEDTRETGRLLAENDIRANELLSYHGHSSIERENQLIERLQSGASVGLVSDRGTPGISDPGSRLIRRAVEAGIPVFPIPGPAAFLTALMAAGVDMHQFTFFGFAPHKKGRQTFFATVLEHPMTAVFYESPHRLLKALDALRETQRTVIVARELTKKYEEFVRGTGEEVYASFAERDAIKGEFVIILDKE